MLELGTVCTVQPSPARKEIVAGSEKENAL
jgi:hypothetical protein